MAFTIDESFLPATLTARPMTDTQFAKFCAEHPGLVFEMTEEGEIIVMAPTFSETAMRNSHITAQLQTWAGRDGRGVVLDSSGGFVLPNKARRSADASWVQKDRIEKLPSESRSGYFHLAPDFVIELRSRTDRINALRNKMHEWINNGAQLGWLINPDTDTLEIYRPNRETESLTGLKSLAGEPPIDGFVLDLDLVWNPLK